MAYQVIGGIHKDFTFKEIDGKTEHYGPFKNYQDAINAWKASVWSNVDNALHRLKIEEI
jgi:Domain of unknown function (DUF4170)